MTRLDPQADKEYHAAYIRQHYRANTDYYKDRSRDARQRLRDWLQEYKSGLSCACGETHPACLDFHHRDPTKKKDEISQMVHRGMSKERILAEIAKCDVLCSNCHRKLHAGVA